MNRIPHEKDVAPPYGVRRDYATATAHNGQTVVSSPARAAISAHVGGRPKAMAPTLAHPSMGSGNRGYPTKVQPAAAPIDASPNVSRPTPCPEVTYGMENTRRGPDTPGRSDACCHQHDPSMGNKVLAEGFKEYHNRLPGEVHHSTTTPQAIIAAVKKTLD